MSRCDQCKFYRPAAEKNAPVVKLQWLADSGEPEVYEEFKRISAEEYERNRLEREKADESVRHAIDLLHTYELDFHHPPSFTPEEMEGFNTHVKPTLPMQFIREPHTVTHCGFHAHRNVYYIAEIRDWANTCGNFEPRTFIPICHKCLYYSPSTLESQRRADSTALISLISANDRSAANVLEKRAGEIDKGIGPAKAHDLRTAYNSKGHLQERLPFLPFCQAPCPDCSRRVSVDCPICHGEGEQVVQPEVFNRFLGCQCFLPARATAGVGLGPGPQTRPSYFGPGPSMPPPGAPPAPGAPPGPAPAARSAPTVIGSLGISPFGSATAAPSAGGKPNLLQSVASQAVGMLFDKIREASAQGGGPPAPQRDANEIPVDQLEVIVPGNPPLTNEMLRRSAAMLVAISGGKVPPGTQSEYSTFVGKAWRKNLADVIRLQLRFIQMYDGDHSSPAWRSEAAAVFNSIVAAARQSGPSDPAGAPKARAAAAAPQDAPAAAPKQCRNGHSNSADRIFCAECGKPLD